VLKRAKRLGWITVNAAADAERVSVKRSGDFNVLASVQVAAVAAPREHPRWASPSPLQRSRACGSASS